MGEGDSERNGGGDGRNFPFGPPSGSQNGMPLTYRTTKLCLLLSKSSRSWVRHLMSKCSINNSHCHSKPTYHWKNTSWGKWSDVSLPWDNSLEDLYRSTPYKIWIVKSLLANSVGMRSEALYRLPVMSINCLHMNKVQLWFHSGDHSPLWAKSWELTNLWNHFIPPKCYPPFLI